MAEISLASFHTTASQASTAQGWSLFSQFISPHLGDASYGMHLLYAESTDVKREYKFKVPEPQSRHISRKLVFPHMTHHSQPVRLLWRGEILQTAFVSPTLTLTVHRARFQPSVGISSLLL